MTGSELAAREQESKSEKTRAREQERAKRELELGNEKRNNSRSENEVREQRGNWVDGRGERRAREELRTKKKKRGSKQTLRGVDGKIKNPERENSNGQADRGMRGRVSSCLANACWCPVRETTQQEGRKYADMFPQRCWDWNNKAQRWGEENTQRGR